MNVELPDSITKMNYDYILIVKVEGDKVSDIIRELTDFSVSKDKFVFVDCEKQIRETMVKEYLYGSNV